MDSVFPEFGWCLERELSRRGHEVRIADNKANYLPLGGETVWSYSVAARRMRLNRVNDRIANEVIRRRAREFQPELILFSKGENVSPDTLLWLRRHTPARLVNWNLDNPFYPTNTSIGHLRSVPLLDCYGAFAEHFLPVLSSLGCPRVEYWPCYFYPDLHEADLVLSEADRARYGCEIVFAASWSPEREAFLGAIADQDLAIWGPGWDRLGPDSPLRSRYRGARILGQEYAKAMLGAACVLNILNMQGKGANNLRTFEATGLGKFLLTEFSTEQAERLFRDGEEVVCFRTPEELREKFLHYKERGAERERIAQRGRERTMAEHTLAHRVDALLRVVAEL
jgi:spore maturation protein CgeB